MLKDIVPNIENKAREIPDFPGIKIRDEFWWLDLPGFINRRECWFLCELAKEIESSFSDMIIVNIGVLAGYSCYCMRIGAPEAKIYGIDIANVKIAGTSEQKERLALDLTRGDSGVVHKEFTDPIHLLFVDGGHSYEIVKKDIENWCPKIVRGGVIAFHDACTFGWSEPISRAIDENIQECWEEQEPLMSIRWFIRKREV